MKMNNEVNKMNIKDLDRLLLDLKIKSYVKMRSLFFYIIKLIFWIVKREVNFLEIIINHHEVFAISLYISELLYQFVIILLEYILLETYKAKLNNIYKIVFD